MANIPIIEFLLKDIKLSTFTKGLQLTKEQQAFLDWLQKRKNKEVPYVRGRIKN